MACPSTISPKVLRINPSPAPTSSSESAHAALLSTRDCDFSCASSFEQQCPAPISSQTKSLNARGRKELPEKPTTSRRASSSSDTSECLKAPGKQAVAHHSKHLTDLRPKAPRSALPDIPNAQDPHLTAQTVERNKQNEFLIQSKLAGMTYRDIKREGGFKEAESTLRGRYRTLTKPKTARVRKPEWTSKDVSNI
jgi:hypothetical protein